MSKTPSFIALEERILQEIYEPKLTHHNYKVAMRKLVSVFLLVCFLTGVKIAGGLISGSMALISDAAHMFTDFLAFIIAILSVWISGFQANKSHTFGFHRAGVIGAMTSVVIVWILNFGLVYVGIKRVINIAEVVVNAQVMFGVACFGLVLNLIMIKILCSTNWLSTKQNNSSVKRQSLDSIQVYTTEKLNEPSIENKLPSTQDFDSVDEQGLTKGLSSENNMSKIRHRVGSVPLESTINLYESEIQEQLPNIPEFINKFKDIKKIRNISITHDKDNINIRATIIHLFKILGDILQSTSIIIISGLIWLFPDELKIADPILTFIIAIIVFFSSFKIVKDCIIVLMEGTPRGFVLECFEKQLKEIEGVDEVHDLHVWSLGVGKHAMSAHVYTAKDRGATLRKVTAFCRAYGIYHSTVQVETTRDNRHQDYVNCKHNIH